MAGRLATVLLFVCSSALVFALDTAKQSFNLILQMGAGTGLLYLVRWFWWRVTAWCEIVAMISSFGISDGLLDSEQERRGHRHLPATAADRRVHHGLLDRHRLPRAADRYGGTHRVLPESASVRPGLAPRARQGGHLGGAGGRWAQNENIPLSLLGWSTGCTMIWSALFMVGNFLYGRMGYAIALLAIFVVTGAILIRVINRLWA